MLHAWSPVRLRDHLNSTSHNSAHAVAIEHNVGGYRAHTLQAQQLSSDHVVASDLPFVQRMHKIPDNLAIISTISDKTENHDIALVSLSIVRC